MRQFLTSQAQRAGLRDTTIANHDAMPCSLKRMVRRTVIVNLVHVKPKTL